MTPASSARWRGESWRVSSFRFSKPRTASKRSTPASANCPMRYCWIGICRKWPLDYDFLRQALQQHCGLALGADKHYFVESRLLPLARQAGHSGVGELVLALKTTRDAALMTAVVEAMTTSESFFFRDKS